MRSPAHLKSRATLYAAGEAMVLGDATRPGTSGNGPFRTPEVEPIELWVLGEMAHQNPVDVDVEGSARFPEPKFGEFLLGPRRPEIGPMIDDVQVGALHVLRQAAPRIALAQRHSSRERPRFQFQ